MSHQSKGRYQSANQTYKRIFASLVERTRSPAILGFCTMGRTGEGRGGAPRKESRVGFKRSEPCRQSCSHPSRLRKALNLYNHPIDSHDISVNRGANLLESFDMADLCFELDLRSNARAGHSTRTRATRERGHGPFREMQQSCHSMSTILGTLRVANSIITSRLRAGPSIVHA